MIEQKKKRSPGYPITINKNVEVVREKIQTICAAYDISASLLFEAIVGGLTDIQWAEFAQKAREDKIAKSRTLKAARLARYEVEKSLKFRVKT